jgi:hypothetical protein
MGLDNFKSNSHKSKQQAEPKPEKKNEKIISGQAKLAKKNALQKIAGAFIGGDVDDVGEYIFFDVVVPAVKDTIIRGIEMILYGESRRPTTRSSRDYHSRYDNRNSRRDRVTERSHREESSYEDIVIPTRGEAEQILEVMDEYLDKYKQVSVADLYDFVGITSDNFTNNNYGWTDIRNAQIYHVRDGYKLKLPRALPLD